MRKTTRITWKIMLVLLGLTITSTRVSAQELPIIPDANKIEGTWDSQLTYKNCTTGAILFTGQSLVSYSQGGVLTAITSGAAPATRSPGLGVWRHAGGQDYESTFKEFRYNADGTFAGKIVVVAQITHQADDTLTTSAIGKFYNAAGVQVTSICPTGVSTRFTGEQ